MDHLKGSKKEAIAISTDVSKFLAFVEGVKQILHLYQLRLAQNQVFGWTETRRRDKLQGDNWHLTIMRSF